MSSKTKAAAPAAKDAKPASTTQLILLVVLWYAGNTFYNIYNKKVSYEQQQQQQYVLSLHVCVCVCVCV
jgi:hypothetical protein